MKNFLHNRRANVSVGLICIVMIPLTFIAWLVTWTPVAMMIDVLKTMTSDPQATRIFNLANMSAAGLLIGEIVVLLVWWVGSTFRRVDQTYPSGVEY